MRVFEEKQWFNQWWLHLISTVPSLLFLIYSCIQWYVFEEASGNVGSKEYGTQILAILIILAVVSLIFIFKMDTEIDEKGITYRFFPIHLKPKNISWHDIEKCYTRQYSPLSEAGGWGYKFSLNGRHVISVRGNQGIQVDLKNGKKYLFGTQKPEEAQQVINKYFKNERV